MRLSDENTREGRHLTPEERIALQAEEIKQLQAENEQLQAQVAQYRDALIIANNYMPDIGQFCVCGKCKGCGTDIGYSRYEYCLKCARAIIDAALSDIPV
jgi:hypothetical protein